MKVEANSSSSSASAKKGPIVHDCADTGSAEGSAYFPNSSNYCFQGARSGFLIVLVGSRCQSSHM